MPSIASRIAAANVKIYSTVTFRPYFPVKYQRMSFNRFTPKLVPSPKGVSREPVDIDGMPAAWLVPEGADEDRAILYLHGGAFVIGGVESHWKMVGRLADAAACRALIIDYRLAPEHPFPAGLDDCLAAYEWLLHSGIAPEKLIVAGDSAGGNLTLALLIALRDAGKPLPAGAVAISPATDLTFAGESRITRAQLDPFFRNLGPETTALLKGYTGDHDPRHPLISPLYGDLHGLPPLLLHVGDHEALLDGVVGFGERAAAVGVDVQMVVWPGMFHVFQIFAPVLPEARQANAQIAAFIRSRLDDSSQGPVAVSVVGDELVQSGEGIIQHGG